LRDGPDCAIDIPRFNHHIGFYRVYAQNGDIVARPQKDRIVACDPTISYFKPRGVPLRQMEEVRLTIDQMEALRLADLEGLSQKESGEQMGVSRATFGRIVQRARSIVADALVNGKAILLEGGNYQIKDINKAFHCESCGYQWTEPWGNCRPSVCPACAKPGFSRVHHSL
jgi:predicted DNA-binding protein (UPF0251 family)